MDNGKSREVLEKEFYEVLDTKAEDTYNVINSDIPVEKISELLDTVAVKVPKLISGLLETVYSAEAGTKMGQSVGNFYKEMLESGIPKDEAMQMVKNYMISVKDIISNTASSATSGKYDDRSN